MRKIPRGNLMSEKWKQYYTDAQIKRIQEIELELLKEFIRICQELNLEYVVYGGTLLGVEKYDGFIPWDDDVDVALPRNSYNRFVSEADRYLSDKYYIQTPYNCVKSPYPYTKLRKRGTKYVEYSNRNVDIETGIYIDIYPIDRIPDDEQKRKQQFKKVNKWIHLYVYRQVPLYDRKSDSISGKLKNTGKWIVCHITKVLSQQYCIKKIDHYMTMYDKSLTTRYAALNSPNYNNIYEELYPLKTGLFEGLSVNIPGDYKEHLKKRYGDYSGLPDEDKRIGHVPYILDLGVNGGKE